jgi:Protein kinase domain
VKIADFGLAKLLGQDHPGDNLTGTHQVMGTVKYMAPEQMEGAKDIDHRADIYSLGVVFYELLTGELPLGRFAPPSKKVQIDVRLDEIVLRALEKEPNQRYQHAGDVKTEVETVVRTPHEAPTPDKAGADKSAGGATKGKEGLFQRIRGFGADFDGIDSPYARLVGFPLLGLAGFCLIALTIAVLTGRHRDTGEMFFLCFVWICLAFLALNVVWFVRRAFGMLVAAPAGPWTPQQTGDYLRRAAGFLKTTGILTFVGWLVLAPFLDEVGLFGLFVLWALVAGTILWIGASRLAKGRDPGTLAMILAMAPLSPAVMLGLPVGLHLLRTLARPEVKALFDTKAREKEAAKAGL